MKPASFYRIAPAVVAVSLWFTPVPVMAQDASASHLQAARDAISALHVTDQFDSFLPETAGALQGQLVAKNPNLADTINAVVQEKTLGLVSRRADLEKEVAEVYARSFSEQELKDIAAFYNTDAGKKLLAEGPIATREMMKAAEVWQQGIARDLAEQVGEELSKEPAGSEKKSE